MRKLEVFSILSKMLHLFMELKCLLLCTRYPAVTSSTISLNEFIAQTQIILQSLNPIIHPDKASPEYPFGSYNLTDTLVVQQRNIECIRLIGFRIRWKIILDDLQIFGFEGFDLDDATFFFSVQYVTKVTPDLKAFIHDIRAGATNQTLSGTEMMILVHYILMKIGVKRCSLHNAAKIRYDFGGQRKVIPLICLRCIRGKTSDWYSDFGYFNKNRAEIATEMRKIYKSPCRNSTFGPWLHALWKKSDITDFHMAYQNNLWRFTWLQKLSFSSEWFVFLNQSNSTDDSK